MSSRAVFFINVPFCVAEILLVLRYIVESRDETAERRIDVPGLVTVSGGLAAISLAVEPA